MYISHFQDICGFHSPVERRRMGTAPWPASCLLEVRKEFWTPWHSWLETPCLGEQQESEKSGLDFALSLVKFLPELKMTSLFPGCWNEIVSHPEWDHQVIISSSMWFSWHVWASLGEGGKDENGWNKTVPLIKLPAISPSALIPSDLSS